MFMSANVWLVEDEETTGMNTDQLKQYAIEVLLKQHNAEISYCPKILPFISIMATAAEIEKIAAYEFTNRITIGGDFVHAYLCLDISVPSIRADDVWNLGYNGSDVTIALIDTGINQSHPDLEGQVILEQDFTGEGITWDTHGHGTHIAGIVAGTGASSNGVYRGVAPEAELLDARVVDSNENIEITWFENAIAWAVDNGADIISCSLGWTYIYLNGTQIRTDGTFPPSPAADAAVAQGVAFVAAAGNYDPNFNPENYIGAPGDAFNVITVGASDDDGTESIDDDTLPG
jgi:subtilisin family serine protease